MAPWLRLMNGCYAFQRKASQHIYTALSHQWEIHGSDHQDSYESSRMLLAVGSDVSNRTRRCPNFDTGAQEAFTSSTTVNSISRYPISTFYAYTNHVAQANRKNLVIKSLWIGYSL